MRTLSADRWFYSSRKIWQSKNDWFGRQYYSLIPTGISPRKVVQAIIQWKLPCHALSVVVVYMIHHFLRENYPFPPFFASPPDFGGNCLYPFFCIRQTFPGFREASRLQLAIRKVYRGIFRGSDLRTSLVWWSILDDLLHFPRRNSSHANEAVLAQVSKEAVKSLIIYCTGRYFFVTKRGKIGIGPRNMELGDSVCSLFGCSVPFIIRPATEIGRYRLLGDAYVHGIMDGELFEKVENGDSFRPVVDRIRPQNFTLA
jgi:hypothetical protein